MEAEPYAQHTEEPVWDRLVNDTDWEASKTAAILRKRGGYVVEGVRPSRRGDAKALNYKLKTFIPLGESWEAVLDALQRAHGGATRFVLYDCAPSVCDAFQRALKVAAEVAKTRAAAAAAGTGEGPQEVWETAPRLACLDVCFCKQDVLVDSCGVGGHKRKRRAEDNEASDDADATQMWYVEMVSISTHAQRAACRVRHAWVHALVSAAVRAPRVEAALREAQ